MSAPTRAFARLCLAAVLTLLSLSLVVAALGDASAAPCAGPEARGGLHSTLGFLFDDGPRPNRVTIFGPGGHYQDVLSQDFDKKIDICLPEEDCPDLLGCVFDVGATWPSGDASTYAFEILVPTCHLDHCYEGTHFLGNIFIPRLDLDYAKLASSINENCNVVPFYPTDAVKTYLLCRAIYRDRSRRGLTSQVWANQALRGWADRAHNLIGRHFATGREVTVIAPLATDLEVRGIVERALQYPKTSARFKAALAHRGAEKPIHRKALQIANGSACYYFDLMMELEAQRALAMFQLSQNLLKRVKAEPDAQTSNPLLNWAQKALNSSRSRFKQVLKRDQVVSQPTAYGCRWQGQPYSAQRSWSGLSIARLDQLAGDIDKVKSDAQAKKDALAGGIAPAKSDAPVKSDAAQ